MPTRKCFIVATLLLLTWRCTGVYGCFAVIVGQEASADGSVLLGHNEQNSGLRILNSRHVPWHLPAEAFPVIIRVPRPPTVG